MIIDPTKWHRYVADVRNVSAIRLQQYGLPGDAQFVEYWAGTGKDSHIHHSFGGVTDLLGLIIDSKSVVQFGKHCNSVVCNECFKVLEPVENKNKVGKLYACPTKGCSVAWWGNPNSMPADALTRKSRQKFYKLLESLSLSTEVHIGCLNQVECYYRSCEALSLVNMPRLWKTNFVNELDPKLYSELDKEKYRKVISGEWRVVVTDGVPQVVESPAPGSVQETIQKIAVTLKPGQIVDIPSGMKMTPLSKMQAEGRLMREIPELAKSEPSKQTRMIDLE